MKQSDTEAACDGQRNSVSTILAAAQSEFGRHGLSGARIANIAQNCGRTKQLIYHYYDSKEALFEEVVWECLLQSMRNMREHDYASLPPAEALRLFLFTMSEQYRLFPDWIPIMLDENIHGGAHMQRARVQVATRPILDIFADIVSRGQAIGAFKADLHKERLFAAALSILTACFFCGGVMSSILSLDLTSQDGIRSWQDYAIGMILDSVVACGPVKADIGTEGVGAN